jgi:hypothetical protein
MQYEKCETEVAIADAGESGSLEKRGIPKRRSRPGLESHRGKEGNRFADRGLR